MRKKKIFVVLLATVLIFMLTGCEEEMLENMEDNTVGVIGDDELIEVKEKEMVDLKTHHTIKFGDAELSFIPIYSLDKDRAENWLFTQSSSINLALSIDKIPDGIEVMVGQVYGDISLVSKYSKYNGIRQDSLNIEYFSLPGGGVSIRQSDDFYIPFMVEGVDKNDSFSFFYNGTGGSSSSRVSESDLATRVHGAALNVVWTIFVRENSTDNVYIKTIDDRLGIPYDRAEKSVDSSNQIEKNTDSTSNPVEKAVDNLPVRLFAAFTVLILGVCLALYMVKQS